MRNQEEAVGPQHHASDRTESPNAKDSNGCEHRFRLLFDAMQEGFGLAEIILDPSGKPYDYRILEANTAAGRLTGFDPQRALGKTARELLPDLNQEYIDIFGRVAMSGQAEQFELESQVLGKCFDIYAFSPERGQFACTFIETTERKRAEADLRESQEQYRLALEATQLGTWRYDMGTQSIKWDLRSREIYGVLPDETIDVEKFMSLIHPDDRKRVNAAVGATLNPSEKAPDVQVEFRIRRRDGEIRWAIATGIAHRTNAAFEQSNVRLIGTVMDITERKRNEQLLRHMNEVLEQKVTERSQLAENRARQLQALSVELIEAEERERRRFAHLLHDDLQQMLAAAKMQLQMVCANLPNEPMLTTVEQILEASIAKTRRLSHDLSPAVLRYSGLVAGLQWLAGQMKKQFGLNVQLETDEATEVEGSVSKLFLFRAVQELLFNVIKHAGVKEAHVRLAGSGRDIAVAVSDQGKGFAVDDLTASTRKTGFGLLSISERANYFGGSLTIDSAPGEGSRFILKVPLSMALGDESVKSGSFIAQDSRPASDSFAAADAGGIRVLFVDDHHVMRQGLIKLIMGQPDIQVVGEAANGEEALELVRGLKPDVVVMDVSMPGIGGVEATRRIKAECRDVHVIGLSMHVDRHIIRTMRAAGADAFVSKAVSSAELVKAIYAFR